MTTRQRLFIFSAALLPGMAQAQDVVVPLVEEVGASFLGTLIAGVLIAVGLQILMTALSVAIGVTAIGDIEKKKGRRGQSNQERSGHGGESKDAGDATAVAISNTTGMWSAVTTTIALFIATWFATSAFLPLNWLIAVTCGLAIWATFHLLMLAVEGRMLFTVTGAVSRAAVASLSSISSTASSLISRSPAAQMEQSAEQAIDHAVEKIHDEVRRSVDGSYLQDKLEDYIHQLQPPRYDMQELRREMEDLLNDIEVKEAYDFNQGDVKRKLILDVAAKQPNLSREDVGQLGNALNRGKSSFSEARDIARSEERPVDKSYRMVEHFAPGSKEDVRARREKVEAYLHETGRDELHPEAIKNDIDAILYQPGDTREVIANRLAQMDRNTFKAVLKTRTDIEEQEAEQIADTAEKALAFVRDKAESYQETGRYQTEQLKQRKEELARGEQFEGVSPAAKEDWKEQAEAIIARRINALQRPELDYTVLKHDFMKIMNDPKQAPEILQERLKQFDRETAVALVSAVPGVSEAQAEKIVTTLDEAATESRGRIEQVRTGIQQRVQAARDEAYFQAEVARRTASRAAWWLTLTALLSGTAAVVAALIAVTWTV